MNIFEAVISNNINNVKKAIKRGCDINITDQDGMTPLHYACHMEYSEDIVEFLINNGADVNIKNNNGNTPLFDVVINYDTCKLMMLIEVGADVNVKNNSNQTVVDVLDEPDCYCIDTLYILYKNGFNHEFSLKEYVANIQHPAIILK